MNETQFALAIVRPFPEKHCKDFGALLLCAISTTDMPSELVRNQFCGQNVTAVI